jgi:hypothetical protein
MVSSKKSAGAQSSKGAKKGGAKKRNEITGDPAHRLAASQAGFSSSTASYLLSPHTMLAPLTERG